MQQQFKNLLILFTVFYVFSSTAYADAGLPMIIIAWPVFVLAFIPIVIIEWLTLKKWSLNCSSKKLFWTSFYSNLFSTVIGIPLTWGLILLIQFLTPGGGGTYPLLSPFWKYFLGVTVQSAWLIPYEDEFYWMIPAALIVLLVPFFFVSYWLESKASLWFLRKEAVSRDNIKAAVWKANINSYIMLLGLIILFCGVKSLLRW